MWHGASVFTALLSAHGLSTFNSPNSCQEICKRLHLNYISCISSRSSQRGAFDSIRNMLRLASTTLGGTRTRECGSQSASPVVNVLEFKVNKRPKRIKNEIVQRELF